MNTDGSNMTEKEEEIEALRQELLYERALLVESTDMFESARYASDSRSYNMASPTGSYKKGKTVRL